ncbi:hypothetical protein RIR_jg32135.t1 [Rhizophagus irregularis DAOM 181602=DAOM 197198]|nr:hypothetical protein RIR_jg32135.t1 [Rhizophagus irregularis DAOM 181602=DAOM 197198]
MILSSHNLRQVDYLSKYHQSLSQEKIPWKQKNTPKNPPHPLCPSFALLSLIKRKSAIIGIVEFSFL